MQNTEDSQFYCLKRDKDVGDCVKPRIDEIFYILMDDPSDLDIKISD